MRSRSVGHQSALASSLPSSRIVQEVYVGDVPSSNFSGSSCLGDRLARRLEVAVSVSAAEIVGCSETCLMSCQMGSCQGHSVSNVRPLDVMCFGLGRGASVAGAVGLGIAPANRSRSISKLTVGQCDRSTQGIGYALVQLIPEGLYSL